MSRIISAGKTERRKRMLKDAIEINKLKSGNYELVKSGVKLAEEISLDEVLAYISKTERDELNEKV